MTQRVRLPNGDIAEFPDEMAPATIEAILKHKATNPTVGEDVAKAAAYALPKAIAGIAGLPHDIGQLAGAARSKLESFLPDALTQSGAAKTIKAIGGASQITPTGLVARMGPSSADIRGVAERVTGPWYDPQTRAGKAIDTAVQTAALMGKNWLTNPVATSALVASVTGGTEGAGALTGDSPWARAGGGLLGGGAPAVVNAARGRAGTVVRDALGDLSPADIQRGAAMQEQARRAGIPLLGTESLDRGHQLASAVLASPSGNQTVEAFLRGRPARVEQAVNRDLISRTGPRATPAVNAARAQTAATSVISGEEAARSAAVSPYYKAAEFEQIPPRSMRPVANEIERQIFSSPIGSPAEKPLGSWYKQAFPQESSAGMLPETQVGRLNQLYKNLGTEAEVPAIGATAEQKITSYPAQQLRDVLGRVLKESNPNIAAGQRLYQQITEGRIDPLRAGPVGKLATPTGFDPADAANVTKVTASIADVTSVRPAEIRTLYTKLNAQDRQAFPGIVQTHLENSLDQALKDLRGGPNPTAGAKFRDAIAGTPTQRQNFDEMMRGVAQANGANPDDVVKGANNLLAVLDRTGRTPGIGSQTAGRAEVHAEMGKTLLGDTLSTISLTPTKPLARRFDDWIKRARYAEVAKALTATDSVQILARMAKLEPNGLTARYYAAVLLGMDRAIAADQ